MAIDLERPATRDRNEVVREGIRPDTGVSSALPPLVAWGLLVGLGIALVYALLVATGQKRLDGAPLHGAFSPHLGWTTLVPLALLVVVVCLLSNLQALPWRGCLAAWWGIGVLWALSLASVRGLHRVVAPFDHNASDYLAVLPKIDSVGSFLATFTDRIATLPVHVQGHPPGFVLLAWSLRAVGLRGPAPVALMVVLVGAAAAPLALVCAREVVDEDWARRAAPFVVVAPAALWIASSADALYAGVGAAAIAMVVLATGAAGRRRDALALAGGVLFGMVGFLSYGLVLLALIPFGVAMHRRTLRVVVLTLVGAVPVVVAFALAGFWWVDGLLATRDRYFSGIASRRPYELFLLVNLSILAIALGPAIAVALWRLRNRSCWLLVGGALLAVMVADLTGMSKSEVERIWLPFTPFILLSGGTLAVRSRASSRVPSLGGAGGWLLVQGCAAIVVESLVRTAW
ncbi:MAG TPA: hypothetical protein VFZ17_08220 [Acidimicrobiia bacterium]|nr:hypothetical protein [Acidimicrobiia bacterium]